MDRRKLLQQYIRRAKRSLNAEKMLPILQSGFLLALVLSSAILIVSRLFVFPYYGKIAVILGVAVLLVTFIVIVWQRVRPKEALTKLDAYYPHNELVTALSFKDNANPLVLSLLQKAEKESEPSFLQFKKRKKQLWKAKVLIGILLMVVFIGVLSMFPSITQQEAIMAEKENEIINDLENEVVELEKKATSKEVKKQLQELITKLKEVESSEEALRETVKKQKELKLQEQQLKERETKLGQKEVEGLDGLTTEELEQLKELMEVQNELAIQTNTTQSALSKIGKPISFDLQNAIVKEASLQSERDSSQSKNVQDSQNQGSSNNSQQTNGQNQQGNSNGQNQSNNGGTSQNQGNSNGGLSGQGNSGGSGSGSGAGGRGNVGSGNGAGLDRGSRDLLSVPERVGEKSEPTVDSAPLGQGEIAGEQKGPVPVTKGTIRPYEEVIGEYRDSYLESSERMQLPKDLQDIVQSYFTTIESNE